MKKTSRFAFTMLELILVIIILGIVSSIGAEVIANVYEQYIVQRAKHRASLKVNIAATQIANRLSYAITGTVIRGNDMASMRDISLAASRGSILQWVGADMDSFNYSNNPAWNGYCDINNSLLSASPTKLSLIGLKYRKIKRIASNLSIRSNIPKQIYFLAAKTNYPIDLSNANITFPVGTSPKISEHYKLAWSSYALKTDAKNDLIFYYDFPPTADANISTASSEILSRNVSTFVFKGNGRTISFKLCIEEPIGSDFNVTACQEKAVF